MANRILVRAAEIDQTLTCSIRYDESASLGMVKICQNDLVIRQVFAKDHLGQSSFFSRQGPRFDQSIHPFSDSDTSDDCGHKGARSANEKRGSTGEYAYHSTRAIEERSPGCNHIPNYTRHILKELANIIESIIP